MSENKGKVVNINHGDDYDVYIGRAGNGKDGYFGNPFRDGTRSEKIIKYKEYAIDRIETDEEFRERVKHLHGKTLGCFCKPKECHGDILLRLANKLHFEDTFFEEE